METRRAIPYCRLMAALLIKQTRVSTCIVGRAVSDMYGRVYQPPVMQTRGYLVAYRNRQWRIS